MEPTLWHISISHYNEKVRWALDYKGVPFRTRAPIPGAHMVVAAWLTRGRHLTFPVLDLDGRRIGDSSEIIGVLEERRPEPALYPADPAERRRALALEDWFDEQLGPYVRRFVFHELICEPDRFAAIAGQAAPRAFELMGPAGQSVARALIGTRYRAHDDAAAEWALAKILAGFDRLEAELGEDDYLAGEVFGVADLTAASLLYPLVLPPEGYLTVDRMPEGVEQLRTELRGRRGYRWTEQMFRRHRRPTGPPAHPDKAPSIDKDPIA
ncbi:MAG: glutathione S-transferase family protein [Solirubrobacterales bacterium]